VRRVLREIGADHDFAVLVVVGEVAEDVPAVGAADLLLYLEDDALQVGFTTTKGVRRPICRRVAP
jgi:hypothetical protein